MRFLYVPLLALLLAATAFGQPPIAVPEGGFADHTIAVPKGASVIWRFSPNPVQKANGLPPGRIIFAGEKGKTYTATAIIVDFDAKTVTDADYLFTFGGETVPPPKKPVDPPVDPIPSTSLYFLVVRADGPADPSFTKIMESPAWATLKAAGHTVKDKTVTEAALLNIPRPAILPCVITLKDGPVNSKIVREAIPLPTTTEGISKLAEGVK